MISTLLKYYERCHCEKQGMILTLTHDRHCGWELTLYDRVSAETIFESDNTSLNILSAEAYIALEKWAREFRQLEDIESNLKF